MAPGWRRQSEQGEPGMSHTPHEALPGPAVKDRIAGI
jgi:hypothetical protein